MKIITIFGFLVMLTVSLPTFADYNTTLPYYGIAKTPCQEMTVEINVKSIQSYFFYRFILRNRNDEIIVQKLFNVKDDKSFIIKDYNEQDDAIIGIFERNTVSGTIGNRMCSDKLGTFSAGTDTADE